MRRFRYSLVITISCIALQASAQDYTDALRYSYLQPQGTARSAGFGNALGSIGGDISSLSENPAGIGIYRSSDVEISPSLKINSVNGTYLNNMQSDNNTRFNFNSAGIVFTNAKKGRRYDRSKWKTVSFGIVLNRLADYNRDYQYNGNNKGASSSTFADQLEQDANAYPGDTAAAGTLGYLGYNSYLVNDSNGVFKSVVPYQQGINQARTVSERGHYDELDFTLGGNYMEKLMLGATLGIPIVYYDRVTNYGETALTPTPDFTNFLYSDELTTSGTGINLKLGAIYKVTEEFRVGAAIHTPTYLALHDDYTTQITANTNAGLNTVAPNTNSYDYSLTTPWRGILSASYIFGKYGFITADYEYVDYPTARFTYQSGDQTLESEANATITNALKAASNFRIGAEARITNIFMLRAGFGYYGSPYQNNTAADNNAIIFSGGLGFHFQHWYADAALSHTQMKTSEQPYYDPYTGVVVPTAVLNNSLNNAVLTVGFRF